MTKISNITKKVYSGGTPDTRKKEYWNGGIKWLSSGETRNNFIYDTEKKITELGVSNSSTKLSNKGSIVMACAGQGFTRGQTSYLMNDMYINQSVICIEPDEEKVEGLYLYYFFKNNYQVLRNLSDDHSSRGSITTAMIKNLDVNFPALEVQKKISCILYSLDKKIELNNEINNNLYEISKQLLLKYLDENSNSEEMNISELLNVFTGKKNANETSPTGKYKFFSCAPESLLSDTYLYDGAAIIVAGNGAYTGRTRFYEGKFELYQRTYGLILKDGFDKNNIYGLYIFMKTIFEPDKMGGTHGSAIPYIVLSDLTDYKLKYNKNEFDKFSNLVSSNIKMIQENEKSNEELSQLRDTLLPKLMNGEMDLDNIVI